MRWRLPALLGALSLLSTVLVWVTGPVGGSGAQTPGRPPDVPVTITVSKTTDLVSGEAISIEVVTDPGTTFAPSLVSQVQICRTADEYTEEDLFIQHGRETCVPIGSQLSGGDSSLDGRRLFLYQENTRGVTDLRPGIGPATWVVPGGPERSLTCDQTHPCRLVFLLRLVTDGVGSTAIVPWSELGYRASNGAAACDGVAADMVQSSLPDRLQEVWLGLTRDVCSRQQIAQPTAPVFGHDAASLQRFANGTADLAYSGVGYRPGFDVASRRPMVPTPVGLNAVVLAVGGGYIVEDGSWPITYPKRHQEFRLSNEHLAVLLGQLQFGLTSGPRADEVLALNPQIPHQIFLNSETGQVSNPLALTGPQPTTLFMSTHLDALAPGAWTDRDGNPRGIEVDLFATDIPRHTMDLKTGRPELAKVVYANLYNTGTYYVLTDYATATALGLTVVSIPNAAGDWVTPTPETLAAAVPGMTLQDDGTRTPNPEAAAGYPLTFVEYAMAPAEPLVAPETCAARSSTQALLTNWLQYLTTEGQTILTQGDIGLAPLTPGLRDEATAALNRVGASPTTCRATPGTTTTTTTTTASDDDESAAPSGSSRGSGSGSSATPAGSEVTGMPVLAATPESIAAAVEAAEGDVELPPFLGVRALNTLMPPAALLVIVALTTGAALVTAGYAVPGPIARLPRNLRTLVRRARRRAPA